MKNRRICGFTLAAALPSTSGLGQYPSVNGGDLRMDLRWPLPFPDSSVRYVFASHVIEHVYRQSELPTLLSEISRVLQPGGVLRIIVPDIEKSASAPMPAMMRSFSQSAQKPGPGQQTAKHPSIISWVTPVRIRHWRISAGISTATICRLLHLRPSGKPDSRLWSGAVTCKVDTRICGSTSTVTTQQRM